MCLWLMDEVSREWGTAAVLHSPGPPYPRGIPDAERSWRDGEEWPCRYQCPGHWLHAGMWLGAEAGGGRAGGWWVLLEVDVVRMNVLLCRAVMEKSGSTLSLIPGDCGWGRFSTFG